MSEVETTGTDEIKRSEPEVKRAMVFIQADVLFQEAKRYYETERLEFLPDVLAKAIAEKNGWTLAGVKIYVSRQGIDTNEKWYRIWNNVMRTWDRVYGLKVYCSEWTTKFLNVQNRKGVEGLRDIYSAPVYVNDQSRNRMICDVISKAHYGEYDVAVLVTKDSDLKPVADEIRDISYKSKRWLKVVNAFPYEEREGKRTGHRGINETDWFYIDYDMWMDAQPNQGYSDSDKEPVASDEVRDAD